MKYWVFIFIVIILGLAPAAEGQASDKLVVGGNKFSLEKDGSREFTLPVKKGDYVELNWGRQFAAGYWAELSVLSPSGKELMDAETFTMIAPADGMYRVRVTLKGSETSKAGVPQSLELAYRDNFVPPADSTVREARKINGYDVKIIVPKNADEGGESILLIEKAGKAQAVVKGESYGSLGFNFADKSGEAGDASAKLFASTVDKTGDGNPDVAVEYYSGGAHCCFTMYFFELGPEVVKIPALETGDASISAKRRNPTGGLILETADNVFAYWNVPFALSPFGPLVLEFRDGQFRPSAADMLKPAPSRAALVKKASEARKLMNDVPYRGSAYAGLSEDERDVFQDAFWGEMIDLIYTGHTNLAWQYLDMVWPETKKGKELFKSEFQEQLSRSQFWDDLKHLEAGKK